MSTAKNAAKMVTDPRLRALKAGESATDSVPGRGNGAVLFECKPSGVVVVAYRYMHDGKRVKVPMGHYKSGSRHAGLTLTQLRAEGQRLARLAVEHGDVAGYLAKQEAEKERQQIERQRLDELESAKGSLADLLNDYIADRNGKATARSVAEMRRTLDKDLLEAHPAILAMKAGDIRPDHITTMLGTIHARGAKVLSERVRAFLAAAFRYGLTAENTVGRASSKIYGLESNPAAVVKVVHESKAVERALSDAELRQFWQTIDKAERVGPIMGLLFQFVVATGGQRVANVIEADWACYDMDANTAKLMHRKGRGGAEQARIHLVPLSGRALGILEAVRKINGERVRPWTTRLDGRPITLPSLKNAINRWLESDHSKIDGEQIPHFTARDLRRTCTQLMQKHGVDDRLSDLLQAHGVGGVVGQHYRNNPASSLPEKRRAIEAFDRSLGKVLGEEQDGAQVVRIYS